MKKILSTLALATMLGFGLTGNVLAEEAPVVDAAPTEMVATPAEAAPVETVAPEALPAEAAAPEVAPTGGEGGGAGGVLDGEA